MVHKGLIQETKTNKSYFFIVVVLSLISGAFAVLQAGYLAKIIHAVFMEGADLAEVAFWLGALAVIISCRAGVVWWIEVAAHRLAAKVKTDLREKLVAHLLALGPLYIARQETGSLVNLLTDGIENMEAYFARFLPQLFSAALVPLLVLAVVFPHDTAAGWLMVATAPLVPFFMILIGKLAEQKNKQQFDRLARLSAHFLDVLQGLTTLKIFGRSKEQVTVIARMAGDFRDTTLAVLRIAFLSALVLELIATISTALVAVTVGLKLLFAETVFIRAFFVLLLAPEFYLPLRLLGTHFHAGMAATTAADQIYTILSTPLPDRPSGARELIKQEQVSLVFDNVHFAYDHGTRPALNGASFTVHAGEKAALVGPSGAGKSTVAALLLGFAHLDQGSIKVNGVPLTEINRSDWLANVAYVPQQPHIFYGTVADNIRFGLTATREEIIEAAIEAGAHDFISQLPQGYDTVVGEGGRSLSGGERQRLAIARAFLRNAGFIILDEATAGLDPRTEAAVQQAARKLLSGRTAIVIAHRLTTVYACDKIIVLQEGQVTESGSHNELMAKEGVYRQMVTAFRGVQWEN